MISGEAQGRVLRFEADAKQRQIKQKKSLNPSPWQLSWGQKVLCPAAAMGVEGLDAATDTAEWDTPTGQQGTSWEALGG